MAMSVYKKVLLELEKQCKAQAKGNSLLKLKYNTEDVVLQRYLDECAKVYFGVACYHSGKLFSTAKNYFDSNKFVIDRVKDYCNNMIMSGKPEWQIMAERNGWKPSV